MAEENPYQAMPASDAVAETRVAPRWLAILVSVLAQALPGAGLLVLGRARPAAICVGAGLALYLLSSAQLAPLVTVVGMAVYLLIWVAGIGASCALRRGERRPWTWVLAVSLVLGSWCIIYSTKALLCEAFQMPAGSMAPTLLAGDKIFVRKWQRTPGRGDLVVFEYPRDRNNDYIKRVVALPGETISIRRGEIWIDDRPVAQSYLELPCEGDWGPGCRVAEETLGDHRYRVFRNPERRSELEPIRVPPGHYFVIGDNRDNSNDSRVWGTVPADHMKGVATVVWYSQDPEGPIRWGRIGQRID